MAEPYSQNGGDSAGTSDVIAQLDTASIGGWVKWGLVVLGIIIAFLVLNFLKTVYTDWLWFGELGLRGVFTKIIVTRIVLFIVGGVIMAALVGASLYVVNRFSESTEMIAVPPEVRGFIGRLITWGTVAGAAILSLIFGSVAASEWETWLRFSSAQPFGVLDPVYGRDIAFYVFRLPFYNFLQGWLLGAAIVILLATIGLHFIKFTLRDMRFQLTPALRVQVSVAAAIVLFLLAIGHWLDRWELLLSDQGAVFGAAYTDLHARKLALLVMTIIAAGAGILTLVNIYLKEMRLLVGAASLWVAMAIVLGVAWPAAVQQFNVTPNEFVREQPYIDRSIEFTRKGFVLDGVEEVFHPAEALGEQDVSENLVTIDNIRLWDHDPLRNVYRQIQVIRPYYDFKDADVDRYVIDGEYRQVMLAAREVAPESLEEQAQTWINNRLIYTHGFGLAMSPVTEFTPEGQPEFFAKDIPSEGVIPLTARDSFDGEAPADAIVVTNPRIYYGENTSDYVMVNTNTDELDYQTEEGELFRTNYFGDGGVPLSSLARRLAYAWELGDINILISSEINSDSKLQYRRNIAERISEVAPFLMLDSDPYLVASEERLFWIQDAYTISDRFPYSEPAEEGFNYIRNSVKVVLDAFNGTLTFYIADPSDPLVQTYSHIFPSLFTSMEEMPDYLRSHIRYPQDLFKFQALKYTKFHMKEAQIFYNNEDLWNIPQEKFGPGAELIDVAPYYATMKIPGEDREEFVLLIPYTPNQRKNLIGWLAARSDGEHYGKLVAFNFPKDRQVFGPEQIEARIDNDPTISQWFTLRCQEGSECIRGNLLVIPIGDSLLYAEPIYLQAEGVQFPELKKVVLATADRVVMEDTVQQAVAELTSETAMMVDAEDLDEQAATVEVEIDASTIEAQIENLEDSLERVMDEFSTLQDSLEQLKQLISEE